jgi:hypothetical protein
MSGSAPESRLFPSCNVLATVTKGVARLAPQDLVAILDDLFAVTTFALVVVFELSGAVWTGRSVEVAYEPHCGLLSWFRVATPPPVVGCRPKDAGSRCPTSPLSKMLDSRHIGDPGLGGEKMTRRLPEGPWDPTKIPRIQFCVTSRLPAQCG